MVVSLVLMVDHLSLALTWKRVFKKSTINGICVCANTISTTLSAPCGPGKTQEAVAVTPYSRYLL